MSQTVTNRIKFRMANAYIAGGTTAPDLRMGLLKTLAAHTNVPDLNTVADMEAHADFAELTAGGYARVALTGEAATEDDANDRANIDSGDVTFSAVASGETAVGAFIYDHNGGADNARDLFGIYDITSTPTNGGDIVITVSDFARTV